MIKNQLYPYIEKYINDYLYGFSKEKLNLAITEGKLELNLINIRPDVINKLMDENNVPFWLKTGLINKIYVGCSLMNLIGEIPLEVTIEGIDIILSPSYKWINQNLGKMSDISDYIKENPIGLNLNDNNNLEMKFDASIFNKTYIEEIFKDKSAVSNIVNSLLKSLYDFYNMPNFAVLLKINKIRLRIEDDELFNYEGKFVLGIKIEQIICKMGFKGNQKKNSLKIENFSIYWENQPKLIISNEILNKYMIAGEIDNEYYKTCKEMNLSSMEDSTNNPNIKLIIDNFSLTIHFGTIEKEKGNADIFDIKNITKKCYFQISSNELVINIYPEFLNAINHFSSFSGNFSLLEKIEKYRPRKRPYAQNKDSQYLNDEEKKQIVKKWLLYFIWRNKIRNKTDILIENPIRAEFNRFYNIYNKKVDAFELLEKIKENKEKKEKEKEKDKDKDKNDNKIDNEENQKENEDNKKESEKPITDNGDKKEEETPISGYYEKVYSFDKYISKYGGDKDSRKSKENYQKYLDSKLKKKYSNFSSSIEILIKGFIINLHPSLNRDIDLNNNIVINTFGIEIKIEISPEQFNFNFGITSLDIGQKDIIYGERIILCPTSYRSNINNRDLGSSSNSFIITQNNNTINEIHEEEKRQAGISGLIKRYNPNHEEKLKIIGEALEKVGEGPKLFNFNNYNYEYTINNNNNNTTLRSKPNNLLYSSSSIYGTSINFGRKSYGPMMGNSIQQNNYYNNKQRNSSFAKNIIENYNEADLRLKQKLKKQKNELNISQAINTYNYNKRKYTPNMRDSSITNLMNSSSNIKLKSRNRLIYKENQNTNNKNSNYSPLNLLEIYSNTKIGALKIKYIKYNNSFSLDDFSIQVGTIRLHPFPQYLIDMITIYLDYQKDKSSPKIIRSQIRSTDGGGMEGTKQLLKMRQDFYKTLSELPNNEKSETIKEYINYLENQINNLLRFSDEIDIKPFFEINYLFSFFPKGIKFYFDYENIECVYYNKMEKMLGKFMISPYNINISISFTKIIANFLGIQIEINNLKESKYLIEKLLEKCQKMLNEKKDIVEFIIEPCFTALKDELVNEGNLDDLIFKNIKNIKKSIIKKSVNKLPGVNRNNMK